jgi:hypothetical protein
MALESSLRQGDTIAAQQNHDDETVDLSWTQSPFAIDIDNTTLAARSVTLWDEVAPIPRAAPASFDDPPKR